MTATNEDITTIQPIARKPHTMGYDEAAAFLGVSKSRLQHLVSNREIAHYKIGASVRFCEEHCIEYVEQFTVPAIREEEEPYEEPYDDF